MIKYCDMYSEVIVNYLGNLPRDMYGLNKIKNIFIGVKNNIIYDEDEKNQNASETLVMGYGNNLDKTVLLYTLLEGAGFKCNLVSVNLKSSSKAFAKREDIFPWYYVKLDFLDSKITLDCTFHKEYMKAWNIENKSKHMNYSIEDYYVGDHKLFTIIGSENLLGDTNSETQFLLYDFI